MGGGTTPWESYERVPTGTERSFGREGRYSIPLPSGTYALRLWLPVKVEDGETPRAVDVTVEGEIVLVGVAAGEDAGDVLERTCKRFVVRDGYLDIELHARSGAPAIAAIEVTQRE